MSVKGASLLLASLALASLGLNLYKRVSTVTDGMRCVNDVYVARRDTRLARKSLDQARDRLAGLNETIAWRAAGADTTGVRKAEPDNEDLVVKIDALERESNAAKEYLVKGQEGLKGVEKVLKFAKICRKLEDEIYSLRETHNNLLRKLKQAARKDIAQIKA